MKRIFVLAILAFAAGCATIEPIGVKGARTAETVCEFERDGKPDGLSGLSRIAGDRYFAVDDSGGILHELEIRLADDGSDGTCRVIRSIRLDGRRDLEGCAYDPLDGRVWVSDEHDHSIRQFDPKTGCETAAVKVPEVFRKNMRSNRSFEALAISPDGFRMYVANEDTLVCDGAVATAARGGLVRIQEFVRTGADAPWVPARGLFYGTEPLGGDPYGGIAVSGVSALCAPGDGSLLVLEREMSRKNPMFPSFRGRLFEIDLDDGGRPVAKRAMWDENTMFANYEGMSFGPVLADGARSLVLVSDGDGEAEERIQVLALKDGRRD